MDDEIKKRVAIIDGIVRTLIVAKDGHYSHNSQAVFDQYDIRTAVAMALNLFIDNDSGEIIDCMNKVSRRD